MYKCRCLLIGKLTNKVKHTLITDFLFLKKMKKLNNEIMNNPI